MKVPDELIFIKNRKVKQKVSNEPMNDKVCVISGGTSGVGLAAVSRLSQAGAHIVLVARNEEKAKKVKHDIEQQFHNKIDIIYADFSQLQTVRDAAKQINETYSKIDVLINSAGIHSTKRMFNSEGFEMVFCVNHLASFLFTYLLLDKLKESAPSRIIQVNSEGHRFNGLRLHDLNWKKRLIYTGLRGYGASKTAQLLTVWELAEQLSDTGVTINAMHPGAVKSNIGNNNGWLYKTFLHHVTWHFLKKPEISGEAIYYLASSKEMDGVTGKFYNLTIKELPAKHALDRNLGKKIYDETMKMTGLAKG